MHLLYSTVNVYTYGLYVRLPHLIASSMGVAHCVTEMNTLFTNCTLCHDSTSLNNCPLFQPCYKQSYRHGGRPQDITFYTRSLLYQNPKQIASFFFAFAIFFLAFYFICSWFNLAATSSSVTSFSFAFFLSGANLFTKSGTISSNLVTVS